MREDRPELYINRRLCRRPMLDQIRPHSLVSQATTGAFIDHCVAKPSRRCRSPRVAQGSAFHIV
jgi:hypothetical protein